jgi:hypothetical protein
MTDVTQFITSPFGIALFKKAKADLNRCCILSMSSEHIAMDDFVLAVSAIVVPAALAATNDMKAPEMLHARENFQSTL